MKKDSYLLISNTIKFKEQLKIFHWQTPLFGAHKAFDSAYSDLNDQIDDLIECYQGKYGIIRFNGISKIEFTDSENLSIIGFIEDYHNFLYQGVFDKFIMNKETDQDIWNINLDICNTLNRLKYLIENIKT